MKRLILRADDLGFSEAVNYGIEKTAREGLITSVGLMTNMKASEHGINRLKELPVCYGQHTNICVGYPIIDASKIPSITNPDGSFKSSKEYRAAKEDFVVLEEVILEIEAQYERFKELTGEKPHYFEGHAVASRNFFKGLEIVAKRHGVRYLPFNPNGAISFGQSQLYMHMESMKADYDPISSIKNIQYHEGEKEADVYICHPGYLDEYLLKKSSLTFPRAKEVSALCSDELKSWIKEKQIDLISYDDIV